MTLTLKLNLYYKENEQYFYNTETDNQFNLCKDCFSVVTVKKTEVLPIHLIVLSELQHR